MTKIEFVGDPQFKSGAKFAFESMLTRINNAVENNGGWETVHNTSELIDMIKLEASEMGVTLDDNG